MQLWATQIVGLSTAQLCMDYGPEFLHILGLVQRDLHRDPILVMTDPAVGELMPENGHGTKHTLNLIEDLFDQTRDPSEFQVIYVFGHYEARFSPQLTKSDRVTKLLPTSGPTTWI